MSILILKIRKSEIREVQHLARGHTVSRQRNKGELGLRKAHLVSTLAAFPPHPLRDAMTLSHNAKLLSHVGG